MLNTFRSQLTKCPIDGAEISYNNPPACVLKTESERLKLQTICK